MVEEKKFLECGETFTKRPETSMRTWLTRKKYCSVACLTQSKRGKASWNKGILSKPNEFIKIGDIVVMYIENAIPNKKGKLLIVDADVHEKIKKFCWTTAGKKDYNDYAWRNDFGYLHRHILGIEKGSTQMVDHINRERFDCRLANLRIADKFVNARNHGMYTNNTSGFNGVCFESDSQKWIAAIRIDNKHHRLGRFKSKEAAIVARKAAEIKHWNMS